MSYLCLQVILLMDYRNFIESLEYQLQLPLPGQVAQLKMSSLPRLRELIAFSNHDEARQSSVLLLLYPVGKEIRFILTLRHNYHGVHGGQISLPGGKKEDDDDDLIYTALREAREEIGIEVSRVQILGILTEMYIPPSNFLVTPVVGYLFKAPLFNPDPMEVARIIEVSTQELLDGSNIVQTEVRIYDGNTLTVPAFRIRNNVIWGATAMILSEFREILTRVGG